MGCVDVELCTVEVSRGFRLLFVKCNRWRLFLSLGWCGIWEGDEYPDMMMESIYCDK